MKETWFLIGDIHGDANPIDAFYKKIKNKLSVRAENNHIIILGDFGANYALHGWRDYNLKKQLSKYPFTYIALRGNHEARAKNVMDMFPEKWEKVSKYDGEIYREKEFPRIEYLDDMPAKYKFGGYKTLAIPGAYSVDKWYRIMNKMVWYEDEQLTEKEMDLGRQIVKEEGYFDLVISHTCPSNYTPNDLFIKGIDQSMVDNSMKIYLGEIEFLLDYKRWACGHFHVDRLYPWNEGKEMLLLFNENVVDLKKFMEMKETDSLHDIIVG